MKTVISDVIWIYGRYKNCDAKEFYFSPVVRARVSPVFAVCTMHIHAISPNKWELLFDDEENDAILWQQRESERGIENKWRSEVNKQLFFLFQMLPLNENAEGKKNVKRINMFSSSIYIYSPCGKSLRVIIGAFVALICFLIHTV